MRKKEKRKGRRGRGNRNRNRKGEYLMSMMSMMSMNSRVTKDGCQENAAVPLGFSRCLKQPWRPLET
jgi:hypothetical protein